MPASLGGPHREAGLPHNFICRPYRGVSVQHWTAGPLEENAVLAVLCEREAYRRTEFVVLRSGGQTALVRVSTESQTALFNPIREVVWLGGPDDCVYLVSAETDTANASALAAVAVDYDQPIVVVEGRYQHVNFIVRARPLEVDVVDVVPPAPSRLFDLVTTAVAIDEDLPPIRLVPKFVLIDDLVDDEPGRRYLLPCQGGGVDLGDEVAYLDQRPEPGTWTLVGCERSRQFHRWFYGAEPADRIELCPDRLTEPGGRPTILRCCLLERGCKVDEAHGVRRAVVPWGANLGEVQAALRELTATPNATSRAAPRT